MPTSRHLPPPEAVRASGQAALLAEDARRLHRTLMVAMLATGRVPSVPALADRLGTTAGAIRAGLATLVAADYVALDGSGRVSCLYPFSCAPTSHGIVIDGQRRFAMCAIDALGLPALLGRERDVEGRCAVCDHPIALRVAPGTIVAATPPEAMVVARRDEAEPAFTACCPFTVFVRGEEHARRFRRRITAAQALSLPEALMHAEPIFGNLLGGAIPARRPRGRRWGPSRDA